ncbi:MAG: tyrosine-type recombinase/integrase [Candidatus Accumulibacter sp.]|jgi:integrase|nr:tyrosine-type recombinase/integrase [Accumulibacter sp.]
MALSLAKWCAKYAEIVTTRGLMPATAQEKISHAQGLLAGIGDKALKKIRPVHVARAIHAVWAGGHPAKARRMLSVARDLFTEAVINGYVNANPAAPIRPLPNRVRRARLSLDHWRLTQATLETEALPWRRLFAILALVTGQRRGDLLKMRFDHVWDKHLHIVQEKTGERIALPLSLRLRAVDTSLREIIARCRDYGPPGDTLIRKNNTGDPLTRSSLTKAFSAAFRRAVVWEREDRKPPSLQECRSLAERLYSAQGIDTQILLGHRRAQTTALYHDDRGLDREAGVWRTLKI